MGTECSDSGLFMRNENGNGNIVLKTYFRFRFAVKARRVFLMHKRGKLQICFVSLFISFQSTRSPISIVVCSQHITEESGSNNYGNMGWIMGMTVPGLPAVYTITSLIF